MRKPQDPILVSVKNKVEKAQQPKRLKVNQFTKDMGKEFKNEVEKYKNLLQKYNKLLEENKDIKNQVKKLKNENKTLHGKINDYYTYKIFN